MNFITDLMQAGLILYDELVSTLMLVTVVVIIATTLSFIGGFIYGRVKPKTEKLDAILDNTESILADTEKIELKEYK